MQIIRFTDARGQGLAINTGDGYRGLWLDDAAFPGDLPDLIAQGADLMAIGAAFHAATPIDIDGVDLLMPLPNPGKIICVGLNYVDHAAEGHFDIPTYPTLFARFATSLLAPGAPMIRPPQSTEFDFEGEMVAVIGMGGHAIPEEEALLHVAGYSIFNDGSVRDYQFKTPQWTIGKNFNGTGAFGPCFVPAAALPDGARGLRLQTRLNGVVVQEASTGDMIFSVAQLVSILSEAITLEPGDIIVTGTPAGVGFARTPPLWMKPGDVCEVEIDGIGILRTPIA
jgi:2-keto-4-pentenoate hydratase/2-oxohepta-3-ene-1,7-dioic acid hydratase in catechol pathway